MNELMNKKLSPELLAMAQSGQLPDPLEVLVQIEVGEGEARLSQEDRELISQLGGQVLDDLWIIKGYLATIPAKSLEALVLSSRVAQVSPNSDMTGSDLNATVG